MSENNKIKALLVEPGKYAKRIDMENSLEAMQKIVNGYIEEFMPFEDDVAIICNDERKLNGHELNRAIYNEEHEMIDAIAGTFIIVYAPPEAEDFLSMPKDLMEKYDKMFRYPEHFYKTEKGIEAKTYDPLDLKSSYDVTDQLDRVGFDDIKDRLFIRVCGIENNEEKLNNIPHTKISNLAITYHVFIEKHEKTIRSFHITNKMLDEKYGISKDQLHEAAIENSLKNYPAKISNFFNFKDIKVLSNEINAYGAAALFYPNQMREMAEIVGGDYYILPSSIHEVLIMPDKGNENYIDLENMVREVNADDVYPEDRLSNNVYHYDSKEQLFELASEYENRVINKQNIVDFVEKIKSNSTTVDNEKQTDITKNNDIEF